MALAEKLNQRPEKKGGEPKRKGRREIIPFITVAALTAAGGAALITPQGEAHAQGPNPTPTPEPSPTPTESGAIIPGVEAGETLAMGGTNWHITKFDAAYYASLLSQLEERFTIIDNGNGLVFNLSYFDSQSRLSIILPHGPQGFEWDGKNQIWRNPQNPNAVLLPQIALPGGWNEEKNIAGPAVVPEVVLMLKDSQRNIRIGTIYNNEALRSAGIVDSNIIPLDNNRSIFLGNPKNLELEKGQRIEAIYDEETNQILYHKLINRDGSWKKILTDWGQVTNPQQVNHMFEPIGIQIGEEITDIPYPPDQLTNITRNDAPIPQFINALENAGINISPEDIVNGINQILPQPEEQERITLSVNANSLNLRGGPSTNDTIITSLPFNTVLTPTGEERTADGWVQVQAPDGRIGWVFSQYVTESRSRITSGGITYVSTKEDGTPLVDQDGNPFVVAVYNLDPSQLPPQYQDLAGPIPLMIAENGERGWGWRRVLLKDSDIIGINTGTLLGGYGFAEYYNDLVNVQRTHFNFGMVDTGAIAGWTGPNSYNYQYIDSDVRLGTKNQMNMMNHLLIWPSRIPDWLRNGNYSREQIMDFLKNWVKNTMKRYPQIKVWEVVNEYGNNDFFQQRLGNDYLLEVFRVAREARPDAILIYNDFANHSLIDRNFPNGQRTNHTQQVVETLRQQGLIDGVGIQMILYADNIPNKEDIVNTLRSYGIPVYITEFQVIMTNFNGNEEQRLLRQAEIYKMVCQAIIESGVSNTIIFFNQSDKVSPWENDPNLPQYSPNADPTLFDDNYQPKLAYYAVLQALFQQ